MSRYQMQEAWVGPATRVGLGQYIRYRNTGQLWRIDRLYLNDDVPPVYENIEADMTCVSGAAKNDTAEGYQLGKYWNKGAWTLEGEVVSEETPAPKLVLKVLKRRAS